MIDPDATAASPAAMPDTRTIPAAWDTVPAPVLIPIDRDRTPLLKRAIIGTGTAIGMVLIALVALQTNHPATPVPASQGDRVIFVPGAPQSQPGGSTVPGSAAAAPAGSGHVGSRERAGAAPAATAAPTAAQEAQQVRAATSGRPVVGGPVTASQGAVPVPVATTTTVPHTGGPPPPTTTTTTWMGGGPPPPSTTPTTCRQVSPPTTQPGTQTTAPSTTMFCA